jgi:hypothetical protein
MTTGYRIGRLLMDSEYTADLNIRFLVGNRRNLISHFEFGNFPEIDEMSNQQALELLRTIVESKAIDASQVDSLQKMIHADWVVDHDEGEWLFRANHALGGAGDQCFEWPQFFSENICRLITRDLDSPGEIDQKEGDWLGQMLETYSCGNETEQRFLAELRRSTTSVAGKAAEFLNS